MKSHTFNIGGKIRFGRTMALVCFLLSLTIPFKQAYATHAMGMDLIYTEVGQDSFMVTVAFYRDCGGVAAPNSVSLRLRSATCNYNFSLNLPRIGSGTETTPVCTTLVTECNGGNFPGSEEYIYRRLVVLPAQCTDWNLSSSVCCRNNAITTINNPGNENIYVEARLNNFNSNSSPTFSNNPVPFVCANQSYCFNNGATDAEGDSLVYKLVTPRTDIDLDDTISFKAGFSRLNPISSNPPISLDPVTGDLCMFPTDSNEIGVLSIIVEEYRNGVLIGSIMRDIQLRIIGCPQGNSLPSVTGIDSTSEKSIKVCANSNLNFNIYSGDQDSSQVVTMTWNNGIPGATFTVTGGNRPVGTLNWTPTNANIRTQPYSFTVEVRDDNCPFNGVQVFSFAVYVVGVQAIVDSIFDPTCPNACDGRITAQVLNGIPPFTYSWDDSLSQSTAKATNLCAGTYTVTGTDSTGCTTQAMATIADPAPMMLSMDSVSVSCPGFADGMAIVSGISNGIPPYQYNWELTAGLQTTDTAFNLIAGVYSVNVTDLAGCVVTDSVEVGEPLPLSTSMITVTDVSCKGLNDGEATLTVSGGTPPYTYQWDSLSGFQTTDTTFNLLAGLHTVVVTDSRGCTVSDTLTITEPGSAITLTLSKTDVNCKDDSTGSATVIPSGGTPPYNYNWDAGTGSQTTPTAVNLPAGNYTVIVTDLNNCTAYPNIMITEPDTALTLTPVDSFVQCFGDVNGVLGIEVVGGTSPFDFQWDLAAGLQTTQYASNLGAGTYKVVITDSVGCQDSVDVNLLEADSALVVNIAKVDVSCNNGTDGSAYVEITGGKTSYTIQWDSASGNQTTDTAFNLGAGNYSVSIVDSFGCKVDTSILITEPPPLLTLTTNSINVTCFGDSNGTASVVVAGGTPPYSYQWSANANGQTTDTAMGLSAGTYFVTVFDSNYCITSPGIVIKEPNSALSASVSAQNTSCFNGADGLAVIQGLGGTFPYIYAWDSLAGFQTGDTAFNLSSRNYTVTVTDSFNCTFDTLINVGQPSTPIQITFNTSSVQCYGESSGEAYVNVSGGGGPYNLEWGANSGSQTGDTAVDLQEGYHLLTVEDNFGCIVTDSVHVGSPAEPINGSSQGFAVSCFNGSDGLAVAEGSGGIPPYQYQWDVNAGNQMTDSAFGLYADTFFVTISDTNACDTIIQVIITQPTELLDSIFISSNYNGSGIQCFGDTNGMATVVPFGGTAPYRIQWDSLANSQTNDTAFKLNEGVYTVTVTDTNGCTVSDVISIGSPQQMSVTIDSLKHVSCFMENDGWINVSGVGGTSPYQYAWNTIPAQTGPSIDSLVIGSYRVVMTDTNGCIYDTTINIVEPTPLVLNSTGFDALCNNQNSGSAVARVTGGTPPYDFLWQVSQSNFQINDTAINLTAGSYPLLITDNQDCEIRDTVVIGEPPPINLSTSLNDTACANVQTEVKAAATGGVGGFTYSWTPVAFGAPTDTLRIVSPDSTTTYFVIAEDANGCLSPQGQVRISVRSFINDEVVAYKNGDVCEGDSTVIYGSHLKLFPPYTYSWNTGATGIGPHTIKPDSTTDYILTIQDICLNEAIDTIQVQVFPNPELDIPSVYAQGCQPLQVQFDDTANTLPDLKYQWLFGDGNGSSSKNPEYTYNNSGTFDVVLTITTANGCSSSNEASPSQVIVQSTPQAGFIPNPVVTDIRTPLITFTNTTDPGTNSDLDYIWSYGDGDSSNVKTPSHSHQYGDTGTYTITLTAIAGNGCLHTYEFDIRIQSYFNLEIPNAFTPETSPNGGNWQRDPDGNIIFYPYTEHPEAVRQFSMLIFNRWGEIIFESNDIYTGWDGFYKSKASPQEVYVYKVKLSFENGQEFEKVGDVTLFR